MAVARGVSLYRKRKHKECRLRVIICPDQIISKDKEAFKQAQIGDPKLNGIRQKLESDCVTVSRG